jgi:small nuclear ribonucleoprotein (snRNP)-like protein
VFFSPAAVSLTSPTVSGTLKGYDQLLNLVMDNVEEHFEGLALTARCSGAQSRPMQTAAQDF